MTVKAGAHVDDDAFLAALARAYLGSSAAGADDRADDRAGATPYTIAITVCDRCKTATQRAGADEVVIDEATLECARCDATELGRVDAVPPPKATRTVPPRVRRAVLARHGGRCAVPGCRHSAFVELHHTDRRADGGDHDPERLVPLCFGHHKGTHVGTLVVRGTYSQGFTFHHADGSAYGAPTASAERSRVLARVLEALVGMGFKQRDAQAMIDRAAPHVGPDATLDAAMRAALRQAVLPSGVGSLQEQGAEYLRLAA
ncbi:MAG: hypothetical protein M5U28_39675 [Sandaracinaceae bacterium]|nr:hypothetical protein [Sandaracinaceae bacterium]